MLPYSKFTLIFWPLLFGCSLSDEQYAREQSAIEADQVKWIVSNNRLAAPGELVLENGRCLDLNKIADPWSLDTTKQTKLMSNGVVISADGEVFGLHPFAYGYNPTFDRIPEDGRLRLQVSAWRPQNPIWASYWVASPERIDENISSGFFKPIDLWPEIGANLEAYAGAEEQYYVDSRRLTQCRNYKSLPNQSGATKINCTATSRDKRFSFSFEFDSRDVSQLPTKLMQIDQAIGKTEVPCREADQ